MHAHESTCARAPFRLSSSIDPSHKIDQPTSTYGNMNTCLLNHVGLAGVLHASSNHMAPRSCRGGLLILVEAKRSGGVHRCMCFFRVIAQRYGDACMWVFSSSVIRRVRVSSSNINNRTPERSSPAGFNQSSLASSGGFPPEELGRLVLKAPACCLAYVPRGYTRTSRVTCFERNKTIDRLGLDKGGALRHHPPEGVTVDLL